ncbi:hypothetical protein HPB48_023829 [Haemaphysalis longicornis]|uniref:Uncharacterized protein n=1 Tax=Haemaphysalis longicornis TaxID=44386 RepID=A0A9J6H5V8_HAELO|nr:hypothetical protein HPB48_023829 [Haemaphysalis longicornis]
MAFMMPVVKQDYDIYSGPNSRKNSVCSTSPGASKSLNSSRNNSVSCSPTTTFVTPEEARKIMMRRRSRGMSECLPTSGPSTRRSRVRAGKAAWESSPGPRCTPPCRS